MRGIRHWGINCIGLHEPAGQWLPKDNCTQLVYRNMLLIWHECCANTRVTGRTAPTVAPACISMHLAWHLSTLTWQLHLCWLWLGVGTCVIFVFALASSWCWYLHGICACTCIGLVFALALAWHLYPRLCRLTPWALASAR